MGSGVCFPWAGNISIASNVVVGGNPLYQISDFLQFYPKFGIQPQAILQATINAGGLGYQAADVITVVQSDASGGTLTAETVDVSGAITALAAITNPGIGTGYQVATALPVTGGHGTGALINVTQISSYNSAIGLPQAVLQAYINLAGSALSANRWQSLWKVAMGLYVAHFVTLYLRSEGSVGTTAQQVAASGLEKGLIVSKAAGDVSEGIQMLDDLEGWGAFRETSYGIQLATFAKSIAPLTMYVY